MTSFTTNLNWDEYSVTVRFRDRVVGGIPKVPDGADRADAYEAWARGQGVEAADAAALAGVLVEDPDLPVGAEDVEGLETGFRRDGQGLYLEARQVKAMLREAAQRLGLIKGTKGTRQVLQHDLIVRAPDGSQVLYLVVAGAYLDEPTGIEQRPISVVTRQGPRTAIKRFEYIHDAELDFVVRILAGGVGDGIVGEDQLAAMLELGQELGLGADRSQGEGTFDVIAFAPLTGPEPEAA